MGEGELWLGDVAGKSQHHRAAEGGGTSGEHLVQLPALRNLCKRFKSSLKFFPARLPIPSAPPATVKSRNVSLNVSSRTWFAAAPRGLPAFHCALPVTGTRVSHHVLKGAFLFSNPHFYLDFQRKGGSL